MKWQFYNNGIHGKTTSLNSQNSLIAEFIDNGQAIVKDGALKIPFETICQCKEHELEQLNLPAFYPFYICIYTSNSLHEKSFLYDWGFYNSPNGENFNGKRFGCFVKIQNYVYTLDENQYKLCELLDAHNKKSEAAKTFQNNLLAFAEIKNIAQKAGAYLEPYLANENVIVPETVTLDVKKNSDSSIELVPLVEKTDTKKFDDIFTRYPSVQKVMTLQNEKGERQRVSFQPDLYQELEKIKKEKKIDDEKLEEILLYPENTFNPDFINLDEFSKRVVEIGYYKPKFYPFISPYKSEWIPGFVIEKGPEEKVKIKIESQKELDVFKGEINKAVENGEKIIKWKKHNIPVEEAKKLVPIIKDQLDNPKQKIIQSKDSKEKVLIIYENVEELEHIESVAEQAKSNKYEYYPPPYLNPNFKILEHQQEGIAWLQHLYSIGISGGLLADDMGLGKTLQLLSFVQWHFYSENSLSKDPYLIVCPLSLVENWKNEFEKFFNSSELLVKIFDSNEKLQLDKLKGRILITTYETIRRKQLYFGKINWAVVILDEAQRIKTPGTLVTNSVKALKADFKIAATGTPVENSLVDLWCIIDFSVPGLLGSAKEFAKKYQTKLKRTETNIKQLGDQLRHQIGNLLQRRIKEDILTDLPQKNIIQKKKNMPFEQLQRYNLELEMTKNFSSSNSRGQMLSVLHHLKEISDHPYLVDKTIDKISTDELILTSAKLQSLVEILQSIKTKNEKVIIFSDRRGTQQLLRKIVYDKFYIPASIINGDTPTQVSSRDKSKWSRQQTIDRFQSVEGFNVIIMSPIAAGLGLNVTEANHVIHYSRHWNPAKEDQATDRVYRIGQKKQVYIYLLLAITSGFETFDIILDNLLERKRKLASNSLFPTEQVEVTPKDIYEKINKGDEKVERKIITMKDVDNFTPFIFEAFIGVLFQKQGYDIILTPKSNDKGADVIAMSSKNSDLLIQVKSSGKQVGDRCVGEILKASGYYNEFYNTKFNLVVATNRTFSEQTNQLSQSSNVKIIDRDYIQKFLQKHTISLLDIITLERTRS